MVPPSPSSARFGCRRLSESYPAFTVRHDVGAGLRELRSGRRRSGRRPPRLRHARVVGHARVDSDGRGDRGLVLLLPLAVPARGGLSRPASLSRKCLSNFDRHFLETAARGGAAGASAAGASGAARAVAQPVVPSEAAPSVAAPWAWAPQRWSSEVSTTRAW